MKFDIVLVGSFLAGAAIGIGFGLYRANREAADCVRTLQLFQSARLSEGFRRAETAYYNRSKEVAIWELDGFLTTLQKPSLRSGYANRDRDIYTFLTHAWLWKAYSELGKSNEARQYLNLSIHSGGRAFSDQVKNATDVEARLVEYENAKAKRNQ